MAKRFTESDKWRDKWFRALRPEHKLAWLYILDQCDCAGVIDLDEELANFQIGVDLDWDKFVEFCGDGRLARLHNGKLHVVRFVEYQYGKLSEQCRPHIPILEKLKEHGITDVQQKGSFRYGNVSDKRRNEVFERDGHVCCYCGEKFESSQLEPDHVIPRSKGGNDSKDNLVAACCACNAKKRDKDLRVFVNSLDDPESAIKRLRQRVSERVFDALKEKDKEQEQEKDKEQDKEKKGVQGETWTIPELLDTPNVRRLLSDFQSMRKRIGKPIKSLANASVGLKHFETVEHLEYALETCIANEYQGLKPEYRPKTNGHSKEAIPF